MCLNFVKEKENKKKKKEKRKGEKKKERADKCVAAVFFFCIPKLYLWGSPFLNPAIEVVTIRLRGCCSSADSSVDSGVIFRCFGMLISAVLHICSSVIQCAGFILVL